MAFQPAELIASATLSTVATLPFSASATVTLPASLPLVGAALMLPVLTETPSSVTLIVVPFGFTLKVTVESPVFASVLTSDVVPIPLIKFTLLEGFTKFPAAVLSLPPNFQPELLTVFATVVALTNLLPFVLSGATTLPSFTVRSVCFTLKSSVLVEPFVVGVISTVPSALAKFTVS